MGDVVARIGNIYLEEMFFRKMQMAVDAPAFPKKMPMLGRALRQSHNGDVVGELVAHQHFGLHAIVVEGVHEPVGCYGRPARVFTCVD